MARSNPESFAEAQKAADEALDLIDEAVKGYKPIFGDPQDIALIGDIRRVFEMKEELMKKRLIMKGGEKLAKDLVFNSRSLIAALNERKNARAKSDN